MLTIKRNAEVLTEAPVSDWKPNLKGKDIPEVVVEAIRRLHSDVQRVQQKIREQVAPPAVVTPPQPVLNTFTELNIGSPATAGAGSVRVRAGLGDPETVVQGTAYRDVWLRTDSKVPGTFYYLKESGNDDKIGWVAKF